MVAETEVRGGTDCAGSPCHYVMRVVPGGWRDVEILHVSEVTLAWTSRAPVAGSEFSPALTALDRHLLHAIRESLGLARWGHDPEPRVVDYGDCAPGCYCDVPEGTAPQGERARDETLDLTYEYEAVAWLSKRDGKFRSQRTGRVVVPKPHQHLDGPLEMNPGLSLEKSWRLLTRKRAKVRLRVKYTEYSLAGRCTAYPVEGGIPV